MEPSDIVSLSDLESRARDVMPHMAYEFVSSGAGDEITIKWNREAFDRIALRPRVLTGVDAPDMRVTLFGRTMPSPIMLAPTAYHRVLHPEGELATARGAGATGVTWIVSSASTTPIEEIANVASAPLWFQLYVQSDREFTREVVERAVGAGCQALCVTVDTPVLGARHRQKRAGFALPAGVKTPHLRDTGSDGRAVMDPKRAVVTWKDIEWLKSIVPIPIVLKGIMDAEDADLAVSAGVDGVIVSNHGGRNLDTAPATIDVLPMVVARVAQRIPVLVDGGISRGTDVVKALALGAAAILIGRPYCYGLAIGGASGVQRCVEILNEEVEHVMYLTGIGNLSGERSSVLFLSPTT